VVAQAAQRGGEWQRLHDDEADPSGRGEQISEMNRASGRLDSKQLL
jgi:hypothetical protein